MLTLWAVLLLAARKRRENDNERVGRKAEERKGKQLVA